VGKDDEERSEDDENRPAVVIGLLVTKHPFCKENECTNTNNDAAWIITSAQRWHR
jgi:hypothetical protein